MQFEILIKIFVFVMGSLVGSFLNVCICRLPKGESVVMPPSHCPVCKKNIMWYDNIPLVSYFALGGKCRSCKTKISFRYFMIELLTALLALLLYSYFGLSAKFFAYSILTGALIVSTFVDFEIQEIPDEVSLGSIAAGLVLSIIFPSIVGSTSRLGGLFGSFIGVLVGGGSIYLMGAFGKAVFRKEAMGGGDVKLMAGIGAFLGWKLVLLTFFMAPFFGGVIGVIQKMKDGRETIPYGPYLSLAALVAMIYGDKILRFFLYGFY